MPRAFPPPPRQGGLSPAGLPPCRPRVPEPPIPLPSDPSKHPGLSAWLLSRPSGLRRAVPPHAGSPPSPLAISPLPRPPCAPAHPPTGSAVLSTLSPKSSAPRAAPGAPLPSRAVPNMSPPRVPVPPSLKLLRAPAAGDVAGTGHDGSLGFTARGPAKHLASASGNDCGAVASGGNFVCVSRVGAHARPRVCSDERTGGWVSSCPAVPRAKFGPHFTWVRGDPRGPQTHLLRLLCTGAFSLLSAGRWIPFHRAGRRSPVPKACLFSLLIFLSSSKWGLNDSECALIWNDTLALSFHAWLQLKSKARFRNPALL